MARDLSRLPVIPGARDHEATTTAESGDLRIKVQEEARAWFMQRMSNQLMTHQELQELWVILEQSSSKERDIDYEDFLRISKLLQEAKAKRYFTVRNFARLSKGRVSISPVTLFNFVVRKEWFCQTKIALSLFDASGQGYLTENDLENYITELIPSLTELSEFDESFHPFYLCIAVRKFFFFLDPHRSGKIKIMDVLHSGFLDSLLELREEEVDASRVEQNWFSSVNAQKLYDSYVGMDEDQNGMLNKKELKRFGDTRATFTDAFIDRFFEENITYDGEIDFKCFVDLMLAVQHKKDAAAVNYFFRILDVNRVGFLDRFTLYYFFKDITNMLSANGQEVMQFNDICTEIFDIVKPAHPDRISCQDLISCSQADVIITLLTDFTGFNDYETRDVPSAELTAGESDAVLV